MVKNYLNFIESFKNFYQGEFMVDYYVPPKEIAKVPAIHYSIEKKENFPSIFKKMFTEKPTDGDLKNFALDICDLFKDGFQWQDIAEIMSISVKYLNNFLYMPVEEKRENVVIILNYLIDVTDTPYLPDAYFDPVFKAMVPSFVNLIVPDSIEEYFPSSKITSIPSDENILDFAKKIALDYKDGFQWQDLVNTTKLSIQFMNQFINTSKEEKIAKTIKIMNSVIDNTDTPYLPDYYSDPIFKTLAEGFIKQIFNSVPTF